MECNIATRKKLGLDICFTGKEHRWSGWPGAYCLDCHIDDPRELCLADNCPCMDKLWDEMEKQFQNAKYDSFYFN